MNNTDEDAMNTAILEFMLGKNVGKDTQSRVTDGELLSMTNSAELEIVRKTTKQCRQLSKAFCTIVFEWLHIDSQLEDMMLSILNIRRRLPLENHLLTSFDETATKDWMYSGFHGSKTPRNHKEEVFLNVDDAELAFSHDLTRHEKIMAGVRASLSNLSLCQDSLGRKLDEALKHHLELAEMSTTPVNSQSPQRTIEIMSQVFSMLAMELYRKQCLSQIVLESASDELLRDGNKLSDFGGTTPSITSTSMNSKMVVTRCCKEWHTGSKSSYIEKQSFAEMLNIIGNSDS